jgi:hypothetical protein
MVRAALALVAGLSVSAAAMAQEAAQDASPTAPATGSQPSNDRVVVTGRKLEELVREFVGEVADPVSSNFGIARWDGRVCVGVENLPPEAAQYVVDRISEVALEVGLTPGEPGCRPEIAIVFTTDGKALASFLAKEEPRVFRPFGGAGGTTQGLHALDDFVSSDAPVRWWQISMPVDEAGNVAIAIPGEPAPFVRGSNSRIHSSIRDELWAAVVIVDVARSEGATFAQMADYLAMVTLAQIDPGADPSSFDSILNLFPEPEGGADRLTDWDQSYLKALYDFDQHRAPGLQIGQISRSMVDDQRAGEDAE